MDSSALNLGESSRQQNPPGPTGNDAPGQIIGSATARAPGVCGELVQGMLGEAYFLVTCPVDFFSRVQVQVFQDGAKGVPNDVAKIAVPEGCSKSAAALSATLVYLGKEDLSAKLSINNPIPRSKGMGSSSADLAAAIAATGLALGVELSPQAIAEIALTVEPTDGVMFPGIALFDHREGSIAETLGPAPPMEIVALDFGGTVDTLEFNAVDRRAKWRSIEAETKSALELVRAGLEQGDPALVGRGSTVSALASQEVLPKPRLSSVNQFAQDVGAVGVNVGHSGTIIGVLLDARQRRGKSTFHQARKRFPEAEMVHHFRLLGGGVQRVPAP